MLKKDGTVPTKIKPHLPFTAPSAGFPLSPRALAQGGSNAHAYLSLAPEIPKLAFHFVFAQSLHFVSSIFQFSPDNCFNIMPLELKTRLLAFCNKLFHDKPCINCFLLKKINLISLCFKQVAILLTLDASSKISQFFQLHLKVLKP